MIAADISDVDILHAELAEQAEKKGFTNGWENSWISSDTWNLIDWRTDARRLGQSTLVRELGRAIRSSLNKDHKARTARVATVIEQHLTKGDIWEAFGALKGWYRDAGPRPTLPSQEAIDTTRVEYEQLYQRNPPTLPEIPIHINPFSINDTPPSEEEVVEVLGTLKNGRASGPSGIRVEDLKKWHKDACEVEDDETPDPLAVAIWEKVLDIVHKAFSAGEVPKDLCSEILVLIPKSTPNQFCGIALLEVIYKLISAICNRRIQNAIKFDDAVHGFRKGRGTGTAIMEAKLLMQLYCRQDDPLYMVFIDLKKAYNTLDRDRALNILEAYGVGPNLRRIFVRIWEGDTMVPQQEGYFGKSFRARRGVRQGDIISPLIFNIMVDTVLRHWRTCKDTSDDTAVFYADDGLLAGTEAASLQRSLDIITTGFKSVGLEMNADKTEFIVTTSKTSKGRQSTLAYNGKLTGTGPSHRDTLRVKVQCIKCGGIVARQCLS